MSAIELIGAVPNEDYTITLEFTNDHKIIWDMRDKIENDEAYRCLKELALFKKVDIDLCDKTLTWPDAPAKPVLTLDEVIFTLVDEVHDD